MHWLYRDRIGAGRDLALHLKDYSSRKDTQVLALPRGGVPVGYEVAKALKLPLDIFVVRKLEIPGYEELALGALASGGIAFINEHLVRKLKVSETVLEHIIEKEKHELNRRERRYRQNRPLELNQKVVILIDDGLVTGATVRAALNALRSKHPSKVVLAAPVGAASICENLTGLADEVICANKPDPFFSVGYWYGNFSQVEDEDVLEILKLEQKRWKKEHQIEWIRKAML